MEYRQEKMFCKGKVKLITELNEFRMSLWINGFGLENAITGEQIIPLITYSNLDSIEEVDEEVLKIAFRIYPDGSKHYTVEVHPFSKNFTYEGRMYSTDHFHKIITGEDLE